MILVSAITAIDAGQGWAFAIKNWSWAKLGSVLFCADIQTPQQAVLKVCAGMWGALHHPQGQRPCSIMLSQPQALSTQAKSACTPPLSTSYPCKINAELHPGREGRQHAMVFGSFKHLPKRNVLMLQKLTFFQGSLKIFPLNLCFSHRPFAEEGPTADGKDLKNCKSSSCLWTPTKNSK